MGHQFRDGGRSAKEMHAVVCSRIRWGTVSMCRIENSRSLDLPYATDKDQFDPIGTVISAEA